MAVTRGNSNHLDMLGGGVYWVRPLPLLRPSTVVYVRMLSFIPVSEFLNRLVTLLSSDVLSEATVSSALSALKEEWMK